ncbi:cellular morphogenesis-related protein [Rhizoctonia solani AG-1 IA]|uniref:Cellular morphogenesis-related protein n=1 Tax=Thanatephorus cucumeris (strain AG1-IA) TaxID=983506 RepID=L8X6W1_THACA|nr:cellular morphogenesis-related protein [Rhizoctonia solani AG-1 IA]
MSLDNQYCAGAQMDYHGNTAQGRLMRTTKYTLLCGTTRIRDAPGITDLVTLDHSLLLHLQRVPKILCIATRLSHYDGILHRYVSCPFFRLDSYTMMYRPLGATVAALLLLCRAVEAASLPEAEVANATVLAGAGDPMRVITLTAPDNSIVANFLSTGATLKNLWVKDKRGKFRDIVLGYDKKSLYASDPSHPFFGGIVGRYANRIKNGTFSIPITKNATGPDVYTIPTNENGGLDTLHGGLVGYDRRNWGPMNLSKSSVTYHLIDPDGTQGFPGTVQRWRQVTYTLMKQAKWKIEMFANSTKKTPILLSSHVYWNLEAYQETQSLADHELQIEASRVIATDGILVPTGELTNVTGTYFDFRNETRLEDVIDKAVGYCGTGAPWGDRPRANTTCLRMSEIGCTGLDNAWIYDRSAEKTPAFSLYSPNSGIKMSVTTDQPALQVYTCNGIANNGDGKNVTIPRKKAHGGPKKYYPNHSCAVIEQEGWIGGINNPEFGQDQIYVIITIPVTHRIRNRFGPEVPWYGALVDTSRVDRGRWSGQGPPRVLSSSKSTPCFIGPRSIYFHNSPFPYFSFTLHFPGKMSMLSGCIPSKPNHLKLVLACYPSNPLAAAPEFKPNAQELSKLSYYATNRAGKLTKLADVFEKRATDEARRAGGGNPKSRASLLITLAILKQLATDCKRDLTLLSTALIASVKASLVALPDDLEVAARAASVFTAWTAYTDGTLIGVDNAFTNNYLATLSMFAKLFGPMAKRDVSKCSFRTRIVGLGAISGAVTSAALFHSLSEFQHQVDAIVPPILFNIHSHELERLNEECEIIDAPNGPSSPFLTEFQPQRPLANRKAASIHAHIDGEKGPSKSDVLDLSLRDLKALFSPSNPAQLGHVMQAIFHHIDNAQLWPNVEWCCWLVDRVTDWAQFPYRFVIPTRLIELLVSVRDEAVPTAQHTTLVATITTVLSSPKHIINLSTGEVAANLIQVVLRRAAIDPMDGLLPALVTCTAALGTHIYYSDQIQDLSEEIINRIVSVQVQGLPGRGRHGADRNRSEAIRCLVACLVGLIKATELNKGRITSHAHKEEVAPTEKGKWRASVDGAASDAEKLAVITSSGRRNPISPEVWQESLAVLAESSYGVRADYARTLEAYIRTELPPEPYGAQDGIRDDESIRRVHPGALHSKSGRQSQFTDATYRFLNALHASAYTLAISAALGLSTDPLAGASQASSSQALAPTPINIVPATPVGTPKHEIPPPVISEEGSKRTPSRGRTISGALALLDPNQGTSSGYRPPSPSDYAHLINVLCAMHERLPVRGLFAGVPMLLALDQAASSIGDNDGNNARGRKQAAREVIAQAWITIGKMWECPEVVNAAEAALTTLSMSSYIPDLPPPHEDLLHPPELAVEWPELELPNFGESSNSNKLFVDPEIVLHALAANERVQNLSGLHQEEILRRLGAEWTVELALKNKIIRADATSPWIKISPALMHIDNHSLASVSRTSRDVGVSELRQALGQGASNSAFGTSVRSVTSGDRAPSARLAPPHSHGTISSRTKPLSAPNEVRDVLDRLGVGSPKAAGGASSLRASFPTINKEPTPGYVDVQELIITRLTPIYSYSAST